MTFASEDPRNGAAIVGPRISRQRSSSERNTGSVAQIRDAIPTCWEPWPGKSMTMRGGLDGSAARVVAPSRSMEQARARTVDIFGHERSPMLGRLPCVLER